MPDTLEPSCFLVDLDDTLYPELDYVDSGYQAIAPIIASCADISPERALFQLRYELRKQGRAGAFDRVFAHFGVPDETAVTKIPELIAAYRDHRPTIALYPGAAEALAQLRAIAPVAIVTDGASVMQRRKLEALGIDALADAVVVCWEHEAPKPSTLGYELAADELKADISRAIVIGDDPDHDMQAATALGVKGVRVRTGRLADLEALNADRAFEEFSDIAAVAASLAP